MKNTETLKYLNNIFTNLSFTWVKRNKLKITFPYGLNKNQKQFTVFAIKKAHYCYLTDNGQIIKQFTVKDKLYQKVLSLIKYYDLIMKDNVIVSPHFYLADGLKAITNYQQFIIAVKENFNSQGK